MASHLVMSSFILTDPATTEIYTLSLHDALPIWGVFGCFVHAATPFLASQRATARSIALKNSAALARSRAPGRLRSEEHTSELQSQSNLVCRLLLEKKNNPYTSIVLLVW